MRLALFALTLALTATACQTADESADATVDETADVSETVTLDDPAVEASPTPLNLNTATSEEFATIPGVGDRMIHEFEEYRPYQSIQQFRREIGKYVDEDQVAAYEPYVFVPVDPNESDAETLQQMPGVGATEAEALIAGRPYDSADAFLTAYAETVSAADAAAARVYLGE